MARRRGKKKPVEKKNNVQAIKKKGNGSDLKPTRCSLCRFATDSRGNVCYARARLLPEFEKVDCVPALIHYSDMQLDGLITERKFS